MSIFEFIVSLVGAFLLLVLIALLAWAARNPETRARLLDILSKRDFTLKALGLEASLTGSPAEGAAAVLATTDTQLTQAHPELTAAGPQQAVEEVQQLRREAVEDVMRFSAAWGWTMAASGFKTPPAPEIAWVDGTPVISFARGTTSDAPHRSETASDASQLWIEAFLRRRGDVRVSDLPETPPGGTGVTNP